jgi:hypothetical protein
MGFKLSRSRGWTHDDLVEIGRRWLVRRGCSLVLTEIVTSARETPDVIGWRGATSLLLEAKISRGDFKRDCKKFFRVNPEYGMGEQRFYIAPKRLVSLTMLPENWGLIEVDKTGKTRLVHKSSRFEIDRRSEIKVLLSTLRRLKVDPGPHISIRTYEIETTKTPKATATFVKDESDETDDNS